MVGFRQTQQALSAQSVQSGSVVTPIKNPSMQRDMIHNARSANIDTEKQISGPQCFIIAGVRKQEET